MRTFEMVGHRSRGGHTLHPLSPPCGPVAARSLRHSGVRAGQAACHVRTTTSDSLVSFIGCRCAVDGRHLEIVESPIDEFLHVGSENTSDGESPRALWRLSIHGG